MLIWREQTQHPIIRRKGQIMIGELLGIGNTASVYEWGKTDVIKIFHEKDAQYTRQKRKQKMLRL
ncbi:hypothetical protein [Paenibacillus jamilae]|uniref:hypothetical protein n=1 Tax=Paenibacillus jamilae TaxID=114136 RepID=UPI001E44EBEC|nr:hypothetical protein [Paenibacillus jamilae]